MHLSKRIFIVLAGLVVLTFASASACDDSSNRNQTADSNKAGNNAQAKWGDPNVTNYEEYKLLKETIELRDRADLVLNAYLQGNDGSLRCFGKVVGFGIPYATQLTPPYAPTGNGAQDPVREPNALFMPESAEATWVRLIDPTTGQSAVTYVEPRILITSLTLPCKPLNV